MEDHHVVCGQSCIKTGIAALLGPCVHLGEHNTPVGTREEWKTNRNASDCWVNEHSSESWGRKE